MNLVQLNEVNKLPIRNIQNNDYIFYKYLLKLNKFYQKYLNILHISSDNIE